jgi:hypothetical protein
MPERRAFTKQMVVNKLNKHSHHSGASRTRDAKILSSESRVESRERDNYAPRLLVYMNTISPNAPVMCSFTSDVSCSNLDLAQPPRLRALSVAHSLHTTLDQNTASVKLLTI